SSFIFNTTSGDTADRPGGANLSPCSLLIIPQLTNFLVVSFYFTQKQIFHILGVRIWHNQSLLTVQLTSPLSALAGACAPIRVASNSRERPTTSLTRVCAPSSAAANASRKSSR